LISCEDLDLLEDCHLITNKLIGVYKFKITVIIIMMQGGDLSQMILIHVVENE
jgi:hypothetical protein